jgi:hypothetical protein
MSKSKRPTPDELKKAEVMLSKFDDFIQSGAVFNGPLTSSEKALIKTFIFFYLSRSQISD